MKSLFMYSRLVFRGGLADGLGDAVVRGAGTTGEVIGGATEKLADFYRRMEVIKTTKDAWRALKDGFNKKANPLERRLTTSEKNAELVKFVAKQLGYTESEIKDALYRTIPDATLTPDKARERADRRGNIIKKMIVLQSIVGEMELTFVGVARYEAMRIGENSDTFAARLLNAHDAGWYRGKIDTFKEMLRVQILPHELRSYLGAHMDEINEYTRSGNPMAVAAKYPQLFLTGKFIPTGRTDPATGRDIDIREHALFDMLAAYEKARVYSDSLTRKSTDAAIINASTGIIVPQRFELIISDVLPDRSDGMRMSYQSLGEGQVGFSGIDDGPIRAADGSPAVAGGAPSAVAGGSGAGGAAGGEKAPDGKDNIVRANPVRDLDTFAKKNKWKGVVKEDPADVDPKRYTSSDISEYVPRIERVLQKIATEKEYRELWPLLPSVEIVLTPDDMLDVNPFKEGYSWRDGKLRIDYDESEERILQEISAGLQERVSYDEVGGAETPEVKSEREELVKKAKLYVDNFDYLFPTSGAKKNDWKEVLENAKNPQKYGKILEKDPDYGRLALNEIRESVRRSYNVKTYNYINAWDTKIGVGKKDSGGITKEQWTASHNAVHDDTPEAQQAKDIQFVLDWSRYIDGNLKKIRNYPAPKTAGGADKPGPSETGAKSADRQKAATALSAIQTKHGYPIDLMPEFISDKKYDCDYDEIVTHAGAIDAAIAKLVAAETPERLAILKKMILNPSPKRQASLKGVWVRPEGYEKFSDDKKRILFKVSDDAVQMAADISGGITEYQDKEKDSAAKDEKEKPDETPAVLKAKIIAKYPDRTAWNKLTDDQRESANFAGTKLSLSKIAKAFSVDGDPAKEDYPFKELGDKIYGKEVVPGSGDEKKAREMLAALSAKHKFNVSFQPGVTYDYAKVMEYKDSLDKAFTDTKPITKKILAKSGVVLGEAGFTYDEDDGIKKIDGKYRVVIDWNEDADEITEALDEWAGKYDEKVKDERSDEADDMNDAEAKDAVEKRLDKIKDTYSLKKIEFESGFDNYKKLLSKNYLDEIENAFNGLSEGEQKGLKDFIVVIGDGKYNPLDEGYSGDHAVYIDYDETAQDIQKDLRNGIEEQAKKESIGGKIKSAIGDLLGGIWNFIKFWD